MLSFACNPAKMQLVKFNRCVTKVSAYINKNGVDIYKSGDLLSVSHARHHLYTATVEYGEQSLV